MKLSRLPSLFFLATALFLVSTGFQPISVPSDIQHELAIALAHRLQAIPATQALTNDLFTPELNRAFTTPDGKTAVLWLALRDGGGHLLATEPGLALARLTDAGWQVMLPGDSGWEATLSILPDGMLPQELSPAPTNLAVNSSTTSSPLTGYYLPYVAGTVHFLEGSISHFQNLPELGYPSCTIDYCHYAYDFTDAGHFPLVASKSGTVIASNDSCSDGNPNCTNYMVLYNASDKAYQLYLHMA